MSTHLCLLRTETIHQHVLQQGWQVLQGQISSQWILQIVMLQPSGFLDVLYCFMICFCSRHRKLEHLELWFLKCILHMFLPLLLQQECVKSSASQPSDCPRLALSLETQGQHITMWLVLFLRSQRQQLFALPASSEGHALFSHYWQLHTGTNFNGIVMTK